MFTLGYLELIVVLVLAILLMTGSSKASNTVKSIGKGLREYHKITGEIKDTFSLDHFFKDYHTKK